MSASNNTVNGKSSCTFPCAGKYTIKDILSGKLRDVTEIFDVSVREPGTTTPYGQTSRSLMENYKLVRKFGIKRLQLISLQYGDKYTVQDQFVEKLRESGDNLSGCFASFPLENYTNCIKKIREYQVPNAFIDVFFGDSATEINEEKAWQTVTKIEEAVTLLRRFLPRTFSKGANGPVGEICVNFGDLIEHQTNYRDLFTAIYEKCSQLDIQIIAFEEFRGVAFPEDCFDAAQHLRHHFPADKFKIIAHMHGGNGLDDACNLSAVLGGADGVWAALVPTAATAGHGSSLVYLTNLMRYGNVEVEQKFHLKKAYQVAYDLYKINFAGTESIPKEFPIIGQNAYSLQVQAFSQENGEKQAFLPSKKVGVPATNRFVPLVYDVTSIKGRLEQLGYVDPTDDMAELLIEETHGRLLADIHQEKDTRMDFNSESYIASVLGKPGVTLRKDIKTPADLMVNRQSSVLQWSSFTPPDPITQSPKSSEKVEKSAPKLPTIIPEEDEASSDSNDVSSVEALRAVIGNMSTKAAKDSGKHEPGSDWKQVFNLEDLWRFTTGGSRKSCKIGCSPLWTCRHTKLIPGNKFISFRSHDGNYLSAGKYGWAPTLHVFQRKDAEADLLDNLSLGLSEIGNRLAARYAVRSFAQFIKDDERFAIVADSKHPGDFSFKTSESLFWSSDGGKLKANKSTIGRYETFRVFLDPSGKKLGIKTYDDLWVTSTSKNGRRACINGRSLGTNETFTGWGLDIRTEH